MCLKQYYKATIFTCMDTQCAAHKVCRCSEAEERVQTCILTSSTFSLAARVCVWAGIQTDHPVGAARLFSCCCLAQQALDQLWEAELLSHWRPLHFMENKTLPDEDVLA